MADVIGQLTVFFQKMPHVFLPYREHRGFLYSCDRRVAGFAGHQGDFPEKVSRSDRPFEGHPALSIVCGNFDLSVFDDVKRLARLPLDDK